MRNPECQADNGGLRFGAGLQGVGFEGSRCYRTCLGIRQEDPPPCNSGIIRI